MEQLTITLEPKSSVTLCFVPFSKDEHVLDFSSQETQKTYFSSRVVKNFTQYTYVRLDGAITVDANYEGISTANYMFYQNGSKIYYCYITRMEYIAMSCVKIYFETDVIQTYMFGGYTWGKSFVEREHVKDDRIGVNRVPEDLQCSEYRLDTLMSSYDSMNYVLAYAGRYQKGDIIDNLYTGTTYKIYHGNYTGANALSKDVDDICAEGLADNILSIFTIPAFLYTFSEEGETLYNNPQAKTKELTVDLSNFSFNGYTPKNNKMLNSPYRKIVVSNNQGGNLELLPEEIGSYQQNKNLTLITEGHINLNCEVHTSPKNYRGVPVSYEDSITSSNYPICSWVNDVYANWCANNDKTYTTTTMGAGIGGALSLLGGNLGGFGAGAGAVAYQLAMREDKKVNPRSTSGTISSSSFNVARNRQGIVVYDAKVNSFNAKQIDDYMTMYGYKVLALKIPELRSRPFFNYVKCVDANIKNGGIPQEHFNRIKQIFDKGITLWHDPSNFLNYDVNNIAQIV